MALGRALRPGEPGSQRAVFADTRIVRALFVEKWPFFALSLLSSLVTLRAQTLNVLPFVTPDFATRLANAATSYVRYLGAFVWPDRLAFLYPYPRAGIPGAAAAAAAAGVVLVSAAAVLFGRSRPYLPFGWFWYLGTLVPVVGLMQVGGQARSDRYTYLTMVGVAVALTWLAGDLWPRRRGARWPWRRCSPSRSPRWPGRPPRTHASGGTASLSSNTPCARHGTTTSS